MTSKKEKLQQVRTRFAPSPTGYFHIGSARTALFNYIFAKQNNGKFILRIEDTDLERSKIEFEADILESVRWLGMNWDEGPEVGGEYGPYSQGKKTEIYKKYLTKLIEEKKAYFCFCTPEDLEAKRQEQMSRGVAPKYDGHCLNLTDEEIAENLKNGKRCVVRLNTPVKKIIFHDLVRGKVEFDSALIGDFVIARSIDNPLFYLAGAIDDYEMKISHVIRGEEHLSNTPKQILIQEALGFDQPIYAHIPLILAPDRSKLSKRHGAVSVLEYRKGGYLPETLINFLAFLGWNPGDEREIFNLEGLVKEFDLNKVQKGGAIFNQKRLEFLNGYYIRIKPLGELTDLCLPYLIENNLIVPASSLSVDFKSVATEEIFTKEKISKIISLYQARLKKLSELPDLVDFFFKNTLIYKKELLTWQKMTWPEVLESLKNSEKIIYNIPEKDWDLKNLQNVLMLESEKMGNRGSMLWPLRVALSGKEFSAGPFEIAEIIGKEKTLERIKAAQNKNN